VTIVHLLITELGRLTTEVGRIDFYAVPIRNEDDFHCIPPNILCFQDAQAISTELAQQKVKGWIGRHQWRKES
jgi:hypothetical protein